MKCQEDMERVTTEAFEAGKELRVTKKERDLLKVRLSFSLSILYPLFQSCQTRTIACIINGRMQYTFTRSTTSIFLFFILNSLQPFLLSSNCFFFTCMHAE